MPLNDRLYGAYKLVLLKNSNGSHSYIIADSATRSLQMTNQPKNLIKGTPKNRIMDIGGLSEDIHIEAPILIGGGSVIDARTLMNDAISNALNATATTLPIIANATITVNERGANISVSLKSDGDPAVQAFTLTNIGADGIIVAGTTGSPLNPNVNKPTRTATFYDFRVNLAGYKLYVMSAVIKVDVTIDPHYFIAGANVAEDNNDVLPIPSPNPYNFGTQYPWLGVTQIRVSGSGSAATDIGDEDGAGNFTNAINVSLSSDGRGYELTRQTPGNAVQFSDEHPGEEFIIEVRDPDANNGGGGWTSLFYSKALGVELFDLSHAVVDKADFKVTPGILTSDFSFDCWVV